ncbi:MBL fold metallo-hydrolase [Ruminococcaceae bacterium OttesenSCG-928-O06]|nr:MBL fold metallo-hydrolase [Ruminococcaceae bacterium OttesenSCG-928-O06]
MPEVTRIKIGTGNCYLLRHNGAAILVDAAAPGGEEELLARLQQLGTPPETLRLLFLTHGHFDHVGAAALLQSRGVPVALHPGDAGRMGPMQPDGKAGQVLLKIAMQGAQRPQRYTPDVLLQDGQRLDEYGIPALVVAQPGHSAGSVCLFTDDGDLLCGDVFMNFLSPHTAHIAEDFPTYHQSLQKLKALPFHKIWPGHGAPFAPARLAGWPATS